MNKDYMPTIGIEVHVELNTKHKAFSKTPVAFGQKPNSLINEIDLGMPGTLPNLNKEIIDFGIKTAIALNCKINQHMYFDRKNYFYADNSKNFQITQAATPIGYDGYLEVEVDGIKHKIEIERMHLEEDTAKSIHETDKTYLDFNRAGVPLIEIVTKPVIKDSKVAMKYLEKLRETLLYLGVSDVKMEEGSMRCDINVSVSENAELGTKTEVKNIGSIKSAGLASEYEINRQIQLLENNQKVVEETRRFDEANRKTITMRTKETGNDYRYFPEPDIPSVYISDDWIESVRKDMPVLPDQLREELRNYGVNENNIKVLINNPDIWDICNLEIQKSKRENVPFTKKEIVFLINFMINYLMPRSSELYRPIEGLLPGNALWVIIEAGANRNYSMQKIKKYADEMIEKQIVADIEWFKDTLTSELLKEIIEKIVKDNPESVQDYKDGKDRALKYLMGQIMKETAGGADAREAKELLLIILDQQ